MGSTGKPNYYELLELTPEASQSDVSKAYQKAKQTYDAENPALYSMFSPEEASELLKLIDEAYNVLSNTTQRRDYDSSMGHSTRSAHQAKADLRVEPKQEPPPVEKLIHATPAPTQVTTQAAHSSYDKRSGDDRRGNTAPSPSQGKTQLSTYTIDKDVEAQISSIVDFNGASLEKVRIYKNISLERMSELTRISRTYLTAVEANDYKNLPAAVFVRGFIVQVSRALGLEEQKVASSYMKLFKAGGGK